MDNCLPILPALGPALLSVITAKLWMANQGLIINFLTRKFVSQEEHCSNSMWALCLCGFFLLSKTERTDTARKMQIQVLGN